MHKLYDLKEMLCEELEEYGGKDNLDVGSLEIVDKLAHALKNVEKIIMMHEEEYSERGSYDGGSYARGGRGGYSRYSRESDGRSYARRRDSMGRYSRRGDYSRDGDMVSELRELMEEAPDERTRQEFQKLITKMEGM